jgi:hypothetical protein
LKKQRKFIAALVAINILAGVSLSPVAARASRDYTALEDLVNYALAEKNFYDFNVAFGELMKLENGYEKDTLLSKLNSITSEVWTKDITDIVHMFEIMAREKSGRTYDDLEARIKNSNMKEKEKMYLFSELYSWGKDTVKTPDYIKATDAVIKVWKDKSEVSALEADKAISELKVEINKEYIKEMLKEAKVAVGLIPVTLDSKYFDSTANAVYTGDEKNVNIDLSMDKAARTITLKGKYKNLSINAPLATVILEDVDANKIFVGDVESHSLYLKGITKVQSLVVDDKNDNAHVVLQGKATVAAAEVRSGAKLEVNTDSSVVNPLGKLVINSNTKEVIELAGNLKGSIVQVQKPVDLKVSANVGKIEVAKEAANTVMTIAKDVKVSEVVALAPVKVDGLERLEKVTGSASKEVVAYVPPTTPGTGSGGGSTTPAADTTAPTIKTITINTADGKIDLQPSATKVIDFSSLITSNGVKSITSADMTLDISTKGQNDTDTKANVNAIIDFTNSGNDLLKMYGSEEGKLSEIEALLGEGLQLLSMFNNNEVKLISGTTVTLSDASGNRSIYTIVIK